MSEPKLAGLKKLTTEALIDSLKLGQPAVLKVRPDGTVMDGHHRLAVLRERGVEGTRIQGKSYERALSMKAEVYWIPGPWPGRLGIVPRPRGGDWLDQEVRAWREAGIDTVVSLLTPEEISELSLQGEESRSQQEGLDFRQYPIPDRGVPSSKSSFLELVASLEERLRSGQDVAVHCRQSVGRSSLLVASLLLASGLKAREALHAVEVARGVPVPDTEAQREWIEELASDQLWVTESR